MSNKPPIHLDASTWQHQLERLVETIANKVSREGDKYMVGPPYLYSDLFVMLRHSLTIYRFLHYLLADERREGDSGWRNEYATVAFPSIRSIIDCLYNVTLILQDPFKNGRSYRLSGLVKLKLNHEEEQLRYGDDPEWDAYLSKSKLRMEATIRLSGFDPDAMPTDYRKWTTLGSYLSSRHGKDDNHSSFLRTFTYGQWRQYSSLAHGSFEGLSENSASFIKDQLPHDLRPAIDEAFPRNLSMHMARSAGILLCIVTELQAYCGFDGARINERIRELWNALLPVYEVREIYEARYFQLMVRSGIWQTGLTAPESRPGAGVD